MHDEQSNARWQRTTTSFLLVLLLSSCAPSVQDCRTLLPILDGPIALTQTPLGTPGCSCMTEDVVVVAEARRHYLSWKRGQLWIDGAGVPEQEFSTRLADAKARHRAERLGAAVEEKTRPVRKAVRDIGAKIKDLFK